MVQSDGETEVHIIWMISKCIPMYDAFKEKMLAIVYIVEQLDTFLAE